MEETKLKLENNFISKFLSNIRVNRMSFIFRENLIKDIWMIKRIIAPARTPREIDQTIELLENTIQKLK